jgi:hypothetical protein
MREEVIARFLRLLLHLETGFSSFLTLIDGLLYYFSGLLSCRIIRGRRS